MRWRSVEVTEPVEGEAPAVTGSVPLAGECPPTTARTLDHLRLPAPQNLPEPVCEELEEGAQAYCPVGCQRSS
jgi:hypothetical protein